MSNNQSIRWLKGALVTVDPSSGATLTTIAFQYNPDELTRKLTPMPVDADDPEKRLLALRYKGAPRETITLKIEIDAIDKLGSSDTKSLSDGIYPQLSALELLVYPQSAQVIKIDDLAKQGSTEIVSGYDAPFTLFVWGPRRVVPVQPTSFDITEQQFDPNLNPIRAKVTLALKVLSYSDLAPSHPGYSLFLAYQKGRESMSTSGLGDKSALGVGEQLR
jgi:hypothetical protein